MKKIKLVFALGLLLLFSCSEDDPIPLKADAGESQNVDTQALVTLDGSGSSGPSGFSYSWSYIGEVPESEINFQGKDTSNPTFTPPREGTYLFTLTISDGSSSDSDDVTILASGAVEIGGTLTEDLELRNIEPNEALPDYIVSTDITIENGIKLSIIEDGVRIEFRSERGINIMSDGILTNTDTTEDNGFDVVFYGDDGWKGILVQDGQINLRNATITNGGGSQFSGYSEAGAVVLGDRDAGIVNFEDNTFIASMSYDIYVPQNVRNPGPIKGNQFSYEIPMKAPLTFMEAFSHFEPNLYPDEFEYLWLLPRTDGEKDDMAKAYIFSSGGKFFVDGDFYTSTRIEIEPSTTIYMAEDASFVTESKIIFFGLRNSPILIEGLEGATWRGFASISTSTGSNQTEMNYTTIRNAGNGLISAGSFTAKEPAAIYATNDGLISDSEILNCAGHGYYSESEGTRRFKFTSTHFQTELAALNTHVSSVEKTASLANFLTFDLPDGVPAYYVWGTGPAEIWSGLGEGNFYLIDADITAADGREFTLDEGCHLKFKSGRGLVRDVPGSSVFFRGRLNNPVVLEGETDEPGSWGGVFMAGKFRIEGTTIKNGGEYLLPGATELANFVSALTEVNQYHIMVESDLIGSAGYGIVVEAGSEDYDYDNPDRNNSFENNASGSILRK